MDTFLKTMDPLNRAVPGATTVAPDTAQYRDRQQRIADGPTYVDQLVHALVKASRQLVITAAPPANVRPTVWSEPVDLTTTFVVPAAAGPYQTAITFEVPAGYGARIEQYGVEVDDPAYTYNGDILWGFRKNGRMLDLGMSDWGEQRGSMIYPRKTAINMDSQGNNRDQLQFMVKRAVAGGGTYTVRMNFRGWAWRKRNAYEGTQSAVTAS